jgi:opacity protein-like surface antigen
MRSLGLFFALLTLGVGVARAESGMVYLGAGVTRDRLSNFILSVNPENTRGYPDISATSWKAVVGLRPLDAFAVEIDYFGQAGNTSYFGPQGVFTARPEAKAFAGYAVGFLPLGLPADLYAKVGLNSWKLTAAGNIAGGESDTGTGFAWGIGVQAHSGRVGARVEYEQLKMGMTNGLQVVSFVVTVNLL